MKRGEVWTAAGGPDYGGKPRPVIIIQSDLFPSTDSITICPLSTDSTEAPLARISVEPSRTNGLRHPSRAMIDKIATIKKTKLGKRIGSLGQQDAARLNDAVFIFLGLGG